MDVEHLWKYSESEFNRSNENSSNSGNGSNSNSGMGDAAGASSSNTTSATLATNPLLASAGLANGDDSNPDLIANLCSVADHRLYKIVKWCKSLPLFKHILVSSNHPTNCVRNVINFHYWRRLTIKYVCWLTRGVSCFYSPVVSDRFQRRARYEYRWVNRSIWNRQSPVVCR